MNPLEDRLTLSWWGIALRGVLAIFFGLLAFFWPAIWWLAVVYSFAAYSLMDGVVAVMLGVMGHRDAGQWWGLLLEGFVGIAVGILTFVWPGIAELALLYVIAGWCLATGVFEIVAAVRLRRYIRGEWLLAASGVLSIILGLALALVPLAGLLAVAWWIGAYALVFGTLLLALSVRLHSLARHPAMSESEHAMVP